ncbi:hypothetical protein CDD81_4919 [Ophiocordyceps australis]|uniref:Uncharacterized protein n=1 Tax=Ophiocordyceps australis TaxID=1399860 RepID=A0A2C5YA85_9HYPO|nr:hypothetical protein CDD81_4919 [Ophiocordyceps australis]
MANGLDRLERLFSSKRKMSASQPNTTPVMPPVELSFPSPSFIRPKTTRMAAREEVRLRAPDLSGARRLPLSHRPSTSTTSCSRSAHKSSSSIDRQAEQIIDNLLEFQFPKPPSRYGQVRPMCSSTILNTKFDGPPQLPTPRCRSPLRIIIPPTRIDTPPSSDPEDSKLLPLRLDDKALPALPNKAPPTPGQSPELSPILGPKLGNSRVTPKNFQPSPTTFQFSPSLHQSQLSNASSAAALVSSCSSTLREPDFNEFLSLSDDDIAESAPESPVLPPSHLSAEPALPAMDLSISSVKPLTSSLLTLAPPRASRPATAAAFFAARIANRYDFDLVYVVNLWPGKTTMAHPGPMPNAGTAMEPKPMMGRLLAAHGLHHVPSPLQISSLVHTTILKADGWIEYRNTKAQSHDLARGYACAFHTGEYPKCGLGTSTPVSGVRLSERIDRGIVFAAYRKPRAGPDRLGHTFSEVELGELHRDAEALTELLLDIHVTNRMHKPSIQHSMADETGPIPSQQLMVC